MNSMRASFMDTLHCPYSGSRFGVHPVFSDSDSTVSYGIATSEAGDFPIVDGILRLNVDDFRLPLVDFIRKQKPAQALLTALDAPSNGRLGPAILLLDRTARRAGLDGLARCLTALKKPMYRVITDTTGTFVGTMKRLRAPSWSKWQIQRFSMPPFLPVYPLLHLVEGDGPVLDFGCGVGQASFLISRRVPASRITCADVRFHSLYLARQFFVGNANFISVDGDYPLPFDSSYFSVVFSTDVVHWLESKLGLCQEFRRVLTDHGAIILPHLHNGLSPARAGKSLSPEGYSALLPGMEQRMLAEDAMVDDFVADDSLDLESKQPSTKLREAFRGLSLVASKDTSLFRRYSGLWQKHLDSMIHPAVNPVYQISGHSGEWTLKKPVSDPARRQLTPGHNAYLPDTASLNTPLLDQESMLGLKVSDPPTFAKLAKRFVIIDVPERFQ
jgi:SAM-dependent methyltransferase